LDVQRTGGSAINTLKRARDLYVDVLKTIAAEVRQGKFPRTIGVYAESVDQRLGEAFKAAGLEFGELRVPDAERAETLPDEAGTV